ncbi:hypothetical protein ACOMHN_044372 [Nucella lapillus]
MAQIPSAGVSATQQSSVASPGNVLTLTTGQLSNAQRQPAASYRKSATQISRTHSTSSSGRPGSPSPADVQEPKLSRTQVENLKKLVGYLPKSEAEKLRSKYRNFGNSGPFREYYNSAVLSVRAKYRQAGRRVPSVPVWRGAEVGSASNQGVGFSQRPALSIQTARVRKQGRVKVNTPLGAEAERRAVNVRGVNTSLRSYAAKTRVVSLSANPPQTRNPLSANPPQTRYPSANPPQARMVQTSSRTGQMGSIRLPQPVASPAVAASSQFNNRNPTPSGSRPQATLTADRPSPSLSGGVESWRLQAQRLPPNVQHHLRKVYDITGYTPSFQALLNKAVANYLPDNGATLPHGKVDLATQVLSNQPPTAPKQGTVTVVNATPSILTIPDTTNHITQQPMVQGGGTSLAANNLGPPPNPGLLDQSDILSRMPSHVANNATLRGMFFAMASLARQNAIAARTNVSQTASQDVPQPSTPRSPVVIVLPSQMMSSNGNMTSLLSQRSNLLSLKQNQLQGMNTSARQSHSISSATTPPPPTTTTMPKITTTTTTTTTTPKKIALEPALMFSMSLPESSIQNVPSRDMHTLLQPMISATVGKTETEKFKMEQFKTALYHTLTTDPWSYVVVTSTNRQQVHYKREDGGPTVLVEELLPGYLTGTVDLNALPPSQAWGLVPVLQFEWMFDAGTIPATATQAVEIVLANSEYAACCCSYSFTIFTRQGPCYSTFAKQHPSNYTFSYTSSDTFSKQSSSCYNTFTRHNTCRYNANIKQSICCYTSTEQSLWC